MCVAGDMEAFKVHSCHSNASPDINVVCDARSFVPPAPVDGNPREFSNQFCIAARVVGMPVGSQNCN